MQAFRETGAYLKGHFRLTCGLHSDEYLQCALVLQHPAIAEKMGRELAASRFEAWRAVLHLPNKPVSARETAIRSAAEGLHIRVQPSTRLIELLCDSPNPQIAADFANVLTSEFIEQNLESRWQTTQHTGEWLARQME